MTARSTSKAPTGASLGWVLLIALVGAPGCGLLFPGGPAPSPDDPAAPGAAAQIPAPAPAEEIPAGLGTLRQDEFSITLRRGELQLMVTPLDESVIRVAAPDTYERLSALARGHQEIFRDRTGAAVPFQLFLVLLYTEAIETTFEPEALNVVSRGLRYRPVEIRPLTPEWDSQRIRPRQTAMAVYAFPPDVDLEREMEVEYQEIRSRQWDQVLPLVEAERSRLRARTPAAEPPLGR